MPKKSKRPASLADYPSAAPATVDKAAERRYRAQSAMETLMRADEHRSDPRLMRDVKKLAAEHAAKLSRVAKR